MENRALWIAFFFTIQFLAVLGENPFKEYFYNKYHHKGHHSSTPEEISSISDNDDTSMTPPTLQFGDYYYNRNQENGVFIAVWITFTCFLTISLCCGCICFCIKRSRGNTRVYGRVVILNQPRTAATEEPSEQPALAQQRVLAQQQRQPMVIQQYLQPVTIQHHPQQQLSGAHMQDPPSYYQSHPVQQQQYPPMQDHSHNPPESPPPAYDFPQKFE